MRPRSPTRALLWEIWRRHRVMLAAIAVVTVTGRSLHSSSTMAELLRIVAFALLLGVFTYTDAGGSAMVGGFPPRLFTLPISSLRLAALPIVTAIAAVELLYLAWFEPGPSVGSPSPWLAAVLLGTFMVFYQTILWTLDRFGPLRLVVGGATAIVVCAAGLSPSFPPAPPPAWRSEPAVAALAVGLAALAFLIGWRHITRRRCGDARRALPLAALPLAALAAAVADALPRARHRRPFTSPAAAQFWFEWRCSGVVLPALAVAVVLAIIAPISWMTRDDAEATLRLLVITLAIPVVLAVPVGIAFARPMFWSDDLSMPAFVAIRPLTDEELVRIKLKVATASALTAWVLIVVFVGAWMSGWANVDDVRRIAIRFWISGIVAGVAVTWRFLVVRLWSGLAGNRPLFFTSVTSLVAAAIVGIAFDIGRLPPWILADPHRSAAVAWALAALVAAKCGLVAYASRGRSAPYLRDAVFGWAIGAAGLLLLLLQLPQPRALTTLLALLAVPLARVGVAPSCLARNRHR